jgi:hypothetical protein
MRENSVSDVVLDNAQDRTRRRFVSHPYLLVVRLGMDRDVVRRAPRFIDRPRSTCVPGALSPLSASLMDTLERRRAARACLPAAPPPFFSTK